MKPVASLRIAIMGTGPFQAALRQFVERNYPPGTLAPPERADVCIIDLDAIGAKKLLQAQRQSRPQQAVIALSLNRPLRDDCIWLQKPFRGKQLAEVLARIQASRQGRMQEKAHKIVAADAGKVAPHRVAQKVAARIKTKTVDTATAASVEYYEPADYLQGVLSEAFRQAMMTGMTLRIDNGWEPILVYPRQRRVWVDADDKRLRAFCYLSLRKFSQVGGEAAWNGRVVPDPEAELKGPPESSQGMEAFLWKVAWWNAAGRLPRTIKSSQLVRLKRWPNLTRLWCPANALRISAFLYRDAATPQATVSSLGISRAEVFSFLSAAQAIGLLEIVTKSDPEIRQGVDGGKSARPKKPGLLGRILRKLRQ